MDHGILNVPLAKRGNIDAQIDRYKAEQAAAAKAQAKVTGSKMSALKADAKVAFAALCAADGLLDAKAAKLGITRAKLVARLDGWAKWESVRIIKAHAEWMA